MPSVVATDSRREPLDCVIRIVTPERIVFTYPLSGPFRRFVAYLVDQILLIILVLLTFVFFQFLTMGSQAAFGPILVSYFLLTWGYGAFSEGTFNGQTVGKRVMNIRVVSDRGVPISGAQAVLRNLVGAVDGVFPFFYQAALASMILSSKFQRLGDLAAGTMVVIEERRLRRGVTRVDEPAVAALLPLLPGRIPAGPDLARALSDYVEARNRFSPASRDKMAEPLASPLRKRFELSQQYSADTVLCAVYQQIFVGE